MELMSQKTRQRRNTQSQDPAITYEWSYCYHT